MAGRIFLSKPRDRSASSDGLEPVIVVLTDGSIRLFSHDDQPLSAHTVLSEFPNMNLASLDGPVSPSAPLLPGETYFLTPRRASAREQASSIRFTTPSPASAFRAPATLPLRSPRALAVLEEELSPEEEEPAEADACSSSATGGGATSRAPHAPSSAAVAEAASLKGKVLAVLSRFNPRHLRRAASASSSKDAMTAAPPPGSVEFARRDADLPPVSAVAARHAFSRAGAMCGDDAESAQGWVDVEGPVLMMTDTRIRHRVPPGSRSCTAMGQQGAFAQQEQNGVSGITSASPISMEQGAWESARHPTWAGPVIVSQQTSFSTEPAGGVNSFASQQLQRAPSLEAAQRAEHSYEHCEEWHSYSSGLAPGRRAWVRLSEDSVRGRSSSAAARNEYIMPPASERYLSGPPLLQAHM
ncbi:unnamed protein product [Closterium sp. NIES-65]|nr:unnamed protein product [Closterium sp. NIES-65]